MLMVCGIGCFLLSIWGALQLAVMAVLYRMESVTLFFDVAPKVTDSYVQVMSQTQVNYRLVSRNCWVAATGYVITLILSYLCIRKARKNEQKLLEKRMNDELLCDPGPMQACKEIEEGTGKHKKKAKAKKETDNKEADKKEKKK